MKWPYETPVSCSNDADKAIQGELETINKENKTLELNQNRWRWLSNFCILSYAGIISWSVSNAPRHL